MTQEQYKNAKPILFNTEMVRAILDGRKTQTRRVVNVTLYGDEKLSIINDDNKQYLKVEYGNGAYRLEKLQFQVGDILYVRETWTYRRVVGDSDDFGRKDNKNIFYKADIKNTIKEGISFEYASWKPSIFMPKEYARLFLKVKNIRGERLQDISLFDAINEGVSHFTPSKKLQDIENEIQMMCERERFEELWNSTAKDGYKWDDNPFIPVYEFEVVI